MMGPRPAVTDRGEMHEVPRPAFVTAPFEPPPPAAVSHGPGEEMAYLAANSRVGDANRIRAHQQVQQAV